MTNQDSVRVELWVEIDLINSFISEEIEFERAEWDDMDPRERQERLDEEAKQYMFQNIDYGWRTVGDAEEHGA